MKLRQLFEAEKKTAVANFGRLNPPTTGHKAMVDEIKKVPGDHFLFLSHSQGAKKPDAKPGTKAGENKDPLSFDEKLPLVKQAFPDVQVGSADVVKIYDMPVKLYNLGYTDLIIVAGSDRMSAYKNMFPKFNGVEDAHGYYKFDSIEFVELTRDEEAEDVSGMSASKLRKAVRNDDFESFKAGLLAGNAEQLFKTLRERLAKDSIGLAKQEEPVEEGLIQDLSTKVLKSYLVRLLKGEQGPYEKSTIEKIKQELEKRNIPVTEEPKPQIKPRDPNAQTMQDLRKSGAMGAHKDKKKLAKQGYSKHKGKQFESDLILNRTALRGYIKDMILDYIEKENDIDRLSRVLKLLVGKTVKHRGEKFTVTDEDVNEILGFVTGTKQPNRTTIKKKVQKQDDALGQKVQDKLAQYRKQAAKDGLRKT